MSDPYLQPNGTLKNKHGITDAEALAAAKQRLAKQQLATLHKSGALS